VHLILDCDPLVYSCGFSAETTAYHLVTEDQETGEIAEVYFAPYDGKTAGTRMQKYLQDNPQLEVIEKERRVIPDTEENAIAATRTKLFSIEKEIREHYQTEFSRITTILSGPGNYRESLATRFPYKGNRDPTHKPYWYQAIRNYITASWGGIVVSGREADDECSILARKSMAASEDYIIATIDKDLDQIPGKHFNYLKRVFYAVTVPESIQFFWQQCLSGDATDGVPGCWRIGAERAEQLVKQFIDDDESGGTAITMGSVLVRAASTGGVPGAAAALDNLGGVPSGVERNRRSIDSAIHESSDLQSGLRRSSRLATECRIWSDDRSRRIWSAIVAAYEASAAKGGCPYARSDAEAVAIETARLVYLQHYEGELWNPPPQQHGWLPGYEDEKDE
jgi:hypothetical protein